MYFFKEGRNTYTVDFDEREQYIREKQTISRKLLKQGRFFHALNVIKDALELCESGSYDEDKKKLQNLHLINLKNKSLCEWKLKMWKGMETTCKEYIDVKRGKFKDQQIEKEGKIAPNAQTINLSKTPDTNVKEK